VSDSQHRQQAVAKWVPVMLVLVFGALVAYLLRDHGFAPSLVGVISGIAAVYLARRDRPERPRSDGDSL
jgi:hypothetical protein